MPDESTTAPVSDAAAAPAGPGAGAATEPAPPADRLGTLAEAFKAQPGALKDRASGPRPGGNATAEESSEESAPSEGSRSASKPDDQPGPPSRRGAAAKISEQQAEIDRLVADREAEKARSADIEQRVRAHDAQRESAQKAALARVGDDREFGGLLAKRVRGEVLSYEDDEKLSSMLAWREHAADLWEMTDRAHKTSIASGLADRVDRYGLDRGVSFDAPLPELLDHVVSVTEARVKKEEAERSANQIKELQAELRGLRTRGAGAASPTVGGASDSGSAGGSSRVPPDGSSPLDYFKAAIQGGPKRPERNGAGRR